MGGRVSWTLGGGRVPAREHSLLFMVVAVTDQAIRRGRCAGQHQTAGLPLSDATARRFRSGAAADGETTRDFTEVNSHLRTRVGSLLVGQRC